MITPLEWQEPTPYTQEKQARARLNKIARILHSTTRVTLSTEGILCKQGLGGGQLRKWHEVLFCRFTSEKVNGIAYPVLVLYNDLGKETARYALSVGVTQAQVTAFLQSVGKEIRPEQVEETLQEETLEEITPRYQPRPAQAPSVPENRDAPLTPSEFSALMQKELGDWLEAQGFQKKSVGTLAWIRQDEEVYLQFWVRTSPLGTNLFAGSSFQVMLQRSSTPQTTSQLTDGTRYRLTDSLSTETLAEVRALQNEVLSRLPTPPPDFGQPNTHASVLDFLQQQFQPIEAEYTPQSDIWFRYRTQADVLKWIAFLKTTA